VRGSHGTILNDDVAPPAIHIQDVTQAEGDVGLTTFSFLVSLSHASDERVTVDFTTSAGTAKEGRGKKGKLSFMQSDFQHKSGRIVFDPGQTLALVEVDVYGDDRSELDEIFFVELAKARKATIADGEAIGRIVNDDSPA
jgi:hypothetical protein